MEMMNGFASCLIKVRQHHIGFPSLFSHYPEGMKHEELAEIHEYVQNAMDQPREIPEASGYLRRVIVGTGKYLIMGVSGYAQHLAAEVQNIPNQLVDFTGRGCPGFIGFVWNLETTPIQQIAFPSLSAFGSVFQELILEHWEDSKNSAWAYETRAGVEVPFKYSVSAEPLPIPGEPVALNHNKKKICSFDRSKENALIYQAILEAIKKQAVSICTDLYLNDEEGCNFLNMTADLKGGSVVSLENARFMTAKTTKKHTPEVEPEQHRTPTERDWNLVVEPDIIGISEDNSANGGIVSTLKGIIPQKEDPRIVFLKFKYAPCEATRWLSSQFIQQLIATYFNCGQEIVCEEIFFQPSKSLVEIYILKVSFPNPIRLENFMSVCEGILRYFYNQKWVQKKENGQCAAKAPDGLKEFRMFVAYQCYQAALWKPEEILLADPKSDTRKPVPTKARISQRSKKQNPNAGPQIPTSNDPLIQQIKQNNSGQQAKKRSDDDPFKCFD